MNPKKQKQPNSAFYAEAVLKLLPIPVVYIDADLTIQFYNPSFQKMCQDYLGFASEDLMNCPIDKLLPALPKDTIAKLKTMIDTQNSFVRTGVRFEYPFEWTSSDTYWDLNLVPFESGEDNRRGMLILASDVSRRINTDLALSQSEERIRRITNNLDIIIYRVGFKPDFHVDFVNKVIEKVSGYSREEYYQNADLISQIIHPDDRHLPNQFRMQSDSESDTACVRWIRKDGQVIWTEHHMMKVYDKLGELVYVEGLARQVSGPKSIQESF